ncbi:G-protein coupled receptor 35-like [Tachyglossus aculeatus]|uniref:G-protein coupled receptor 35-like n=1 Tax=Tachyglossus aculeatus TaxID=9261 RepID=UPI0018F5243F|nr:G-protein coupled receptor 35-like [Tachyglossus aculeatus]
MGQGSSARERQQPHPGGGELLLGETTMSWAMNSTMNCSYTSISSTSEIIYISLLLVFGILLNAVALWVFCYKMRHWTETGVYMANLAMADLSLLFALPFVIWTLKMPDSQEGLLCKIPQSIYLINKHMSIYIVTLIALDRYISVKYPLQSRILRSPKKAALACALLWIFVISLVSILFTVPFQEGGFCFGSSTVRNSITLFSLLGFFIPLVILTFCSSQVIISLVKKTKTDPYEEQLIKKAVYMVSANLIVFVICFLPLHVALLIRYVIELTSCSALERMQMFIKVSSRLANANCCLDAICYYFVAKEFQQASDLSMLTIAKSKSNRSQNSQGETLS